MLTFKLAQHSRDKNLIESLKNYLECGNVYYKTNHVEYDIFKFEDLINKIIPFFDKYNILGVKNKDYLDFKKVLELMKNKEHLTSEGINIIFKIINNMNKGRDIY
jgi:hypothetical protein